MNTTSDGSEPSVSGMARNIRIDAAYIGWRTTPYSPVSITFCPC